MNIVLDQVFYGRGERGYAILGASPGVAACAARVESLCGAVGTPGSEYGGEPFLLSVPEKDRVIMVCGRRGAPDSMGRATLFFHALIAVKQDLARVKVDAFSLWGRGAFADAMPVGEIAPLQLDVGSDSGKSEERHLDVVLPCLFRSEGSAPDLIRSALGERVNDLAWATYSFQPLPDFDVQVLPLRVLAPQTINEYDASGKMVRAARADGATRDVVGPAPDRQRPQSAAAPITKTPPPGKSNAMLKFSLIMNLALAAACFVLYASRKSANGTPGLPPERLVVTNVVERIVEKKVEASMTGEQKAEIAREEFKRLKGKFHFLKIEDFDGEAKGAIKNYELQGIDPKYDRQKEFLEKLRAYVNFVNELQEKQHHE